MPWCCNSHVRDVVPPCHVLGGGSGRLVGRRRDSERPPPDRQWRVRGVPFELTHSATTGRWRFAQNFSGWPPLDDRFTAANLDPALAQPGHHLSLGFEG